MLNLKFICIIVSPAKYLLGFLSLVFSNRNQLLHMKIGFAEDQGKESQEKFFQ